MRTALKFAALTCLLLPMAACCTSMEKRAGTPMLNDLSAWKVPSPNPFWTLNKGLLVGENDAALTGNDLLTLKEYKDFDFQTDFRYSEGADSGILFRKPLLQVQVGISRSLMVEKTGSLYEEGPQGHYIAHATGVENVLKPKDWNTLRFVAKGGTLNVWVNGKHVLETDISRFPDAAPIGLQLHQGLKMKIEFRNLTIREL